MDRSQTLMLGGVAAYCPDCDDERILVEAAEGDFCCTSCDAAVLVPELAPDVLRGAPRVEERRAG